MTFCCQSGRSFAYAPFNTAKPWKLNDDTRSVVFAKRVYRSISTAAREAAVCFLLVAKRLKLVRDVSVVIAKQVYAQRGQETGLWWPCLDHLSRLV